MNCIHCGNDIPYGAVTCPSCGAPAPAQQPPPPQQQYAPPPPQQYAPPPQQQYYAPPPPQQQYYAPPPPPQSTKSRLVYVILAFFLGGFGVHNFYAGRTAAGVIQLLLTLLTCGAGSVIVFFWLIFDILFVKKDGQGLRMKPMPWIILLLVLLGLGVVFVADDFRIRNGRVVILDPVRVCIVWSCYGISGRRDVDSFPHVVVAFDVRPSGACVGVGHRFDVRDRI